jgi:RNA 2',3'-cyclic 3'-phosphodiesterase
MSKAISWASTALLLNSRGALEAAVFMRYEAEKTDRTAEDTLRAFLCIEIPESIKLRLASLQQDLRRIEAQVSWVKPSNIHLTLKFLGDVPASRIEQIRQGVERASSAIRKFEIEVGSAGCFPNPRSPRVLWVGFPVLPENLKRLHEAIEDELTRAGFPRESKRFSPHLTIGRVRAPKGADRVAEELISRGFEPERFEVREVILMRSELNPKGSIYTRLSTTHLKD